jgi:hypothetical protein
MVPFWGSSRTEVQRNCGTSVVAICRWKNIDWRALEQGQKSKWDEEGRLELVLMHFSVEAQTQEYFREDNHRAMPWLTHTV